MADITPAKFSDNYEPIGQIQIEEEVYSVFPPDTLQERFYINYYDARSEIMEVVDRYNEIDANGNVVRAYDPKSVGRMEVEMIKPARNMIEALFELPPDSLEIRPRTVIAIYNKVEEFLNSHYSSNSEEEDVPQPSKQKSKRSSKKNSSKSTSTASSTTSSSSSASD